MAEREFPKRPLVGVAGVVVRRGRVLVVRRGHEPLKGQWSLPGGLVELGESLRAALRREIYEETGLDAEPSHLIDVAERIVTAAAGSRGARPMPGSPAIRTTARRSSRVRYHYVIAGYLCCICGGRLRPGSDVLEARFVAPTDLTHYRLSREARAVIRQALHSTAREVKAEFSRERS